MTKDLLDKIDVGMFMWLIQRYAMAMTSNRQETSILKIISFPSIYVLQFFNSYTRVS